MADPKAPEMPEGWRAVYRRFADVMPWKWDHSTGAWLDLDGIRALLSAHGLAIVSEADRKVLEAMAKAPETTLLRYPDVAVCVAELEARKTRAK
jgi:hypothetical protein